MPEVPEEQAIRLLAAAYELARQRSRGECSLTDTVMKIEAMERQQKHMTDYLEALVTITTQTSGLSACAAKRAKAN